MYFVSKFGFFFWSFWCLGLPGASPKLPQESPRAPWRPKGRLLTICSDIWESVSGAFWLIFGVFFAARFRCFLLDLLMPFCLNIDMLLVPFGSHFEAKNYKTSYRFSDTVLMWILAPPGHLPEPKPLRMFGELFKIEGRPFRARAPPGPILGAKMEPKLKPGAHKIN